MLRTTRRAFVALLLSAVLVPAVRAQSDTERPSAPLPAAGTRLPLASVRAVESVVVNVGDLAARESAAPAWVGGALTPIAILQGEQRLARPKQPYVEPEVQAPFESYALPAPGPRAFVASPAPSLSFIGLDDIPRVGTSSITIPPDVDGAVGPNHVVETLNNNYRFFNRNTGAVLSTISITTFWTPAGGSGYFDPKILYDPIQQRWIATAVSNAANVASSVLLGISQTNDPTGSWYLYRVLGDSTGVNWADFPCIGYNKNWVAINLNMFSNAANASAGAKCLVVDYPQARAGVFVARYITGTGFCSAPVITESATEETLYAPTHLSSASGTYRLDRITGTPSAPVYTVGTTRSRGLTWAQPSGNILPQAAPLSGTSVCGATPCKLASQDSQLRTSPVMRNGSIWYTQTVGLPATGGIQRTAVQWTKLDAVSGNVLDGGRIDDPTATATNGGFWYNYSSIAVNDAGDVVLAMSRFSSSTYPSAAYAFRAGSDVAGTFRDPYVYKAGDDYYNKDFGSGRNRWGDYVRALQDPNDPKAFWVVSQYAKSRTGTDDGTTGSNSSKWGTWWARLSPVVNAGASVLVTEGNAGTTSVNVDVELTMPLGTAVTADWTLNAGTATAGVDFVAASGTVTIPAGSTSVPVSVTVNGDRVRENDETLTFQLLSVSGASLGSVTTSTVTITNDDPLPTLTLDAPSGSEGSPIAFTATLSNPSAFTVTVPWVLADSTATGGSDYVAAAGSLVFAAGDTAESLVVATLEDTVDEDDEVFRVVLGTPVQAVLASPQAVGTVVDDDAAPTVSITTSLALAESDPTPYPLIVTLSHASVREVRVDFATVDSTATGGSDYVVRTGTLVLPPLTTSAVLDSVQALDDAEYESTEWFHVRLSNAVNAVLDSSARATAVSITDDDGAPALVLGSVSAVEGAPVRIPVTLTQPVGGTVTARVQVVGGTATIADGDFAALTDTVVTFAPYATSDTVSVTVIADGRCEPDETIELRLVELTGPVDTTGSVATVTVVNDDECVAPVVTVLAPNGGESLVPTLNTTIGWSASDDTGVTGVDLAWSSDGGSTWTPLATGEGNDGSFTWTVPNTLTTLGLVRVTAHDAAGNSAADVSDAVFAVVTAAGGVDGGAVTAFALAPVTPNPTVGAARLDFALPRESRVRLSVVDLMGRTVAVLADGVFPAGRHTARWDGPAAGASRAAGIYFARLEAGSFHATRRFAVTR
ncbi:MAG: Calx-beta domain-containing protein [bacterium]